MPPMYSLAVRPVGASRGRHVPTFVASTRRPPSPQVPVSEHHAATRAARRCLSWRAPSRAAL
eukprot:2099470-Prymnesium_polylepis.1